MKLPSLAPKLPKIKKPKAMKPTVPRPQHPKKGLGRVPNRRMKIPGIQTPRL